MCIFIAQQSVYLPTYILMWISWKQDWLVQKLFSCIKAIQSFLVVAASSKIVRSYSFIHGSETPNINVNCELSFIY
jgi:hypothetical protein